MSRKDKINDPQTKNVLAKAKMKGQISKSLTEGFLDEEYSTSLEYLDDKRMMAVIESILFFSDRPVTLESFKYAFEGTDVDLKRIKKALLDYASCLAEADRGVYLEQIASGYQLRTKHDCMDFLKKLKKTRPFRLSSSNLEVLSIVAYEQPCIKARIDEIRAVDSGHLLRNLMDKGLVAFYGKSDLPGKPMLYKTTKKFLEIFGLKNLKELPPMSEIETLLPDGLLDEQDIQEQYKFPLSDLSEDLKTRQDQQALKAQEDYVKTEKELKTVEENLKHIQIPKEQPSLDAPKEDL